MPDDLTTLRHNLEHAEHALSRAEQARDDWELDIDSGSARQAYDDFLDESHGTFMGISASRILKEMDEIAYNEGFDYWADNYFAGMAEREKRAQFSDFDELCEAVEEAESERDAAIEALEEAEEDLEVDIEGVES